MISEADIWFNINDFAEEVSLYSKAGVLLRKANLIFYDVGTTQTVGDVTIINDTPTALINAANVTDVVQGCYFTRASGTKYYIEQNLPQGDGTNNLILTKDAI